MTESADETMRYAYEQARLMTDRVNELVQPFVDLAESLTRTLDRLPEPVRLPVPYEGLSASETALEVPGLLLDQTEDEKLSRALREVQEATTHSMELDVLVRIRIEPDGQEAHDGYYLEVTYPAELTDERLVFVWDIDAQSLHHIETRKGSPVTSVVDVRAVAGAVRTLLPGQS